MHERLAADESNAHGAKVANFPYPFFQIVEARVRPAIVVFGAIGAIEIATICDVQAALQGFSVEETPTRFQNVIAGKFTADSIEELHADNERICSLRQLACEAIALADITSQRSIRLISMGKMSLTFGHVFPQLQRNGQHGSQEEVG
jgi:hypothetical protein